jgi:sigma-B regulation protein RsbU (phosphoserine phosphatase)
MYAVDPQLTASQVLQAFRHDELYLCLGAAFITVGQVSAAFSFLRRKFDAVLFWLALSAILYGLRLWLQLDFVSLLVPHTNFFRSLRIAGNYLVPIPAVFYFEAAGFLGRYGRKVAIALTVPFLCLFVGTFMVGPRDVFDLINNLIVILSLIALAVLSFTRKNSDRDFFIIRLGVVVFIAFALYDNIYGALGNHPFKEPMGFAFFLLTLGYVAAKRTLHRDHQFSEIQKELEIARRIQTSILPSGYPPSAHFKVAARYVPMTAVAGDFYDFLVADQTRAGLLIADVAGHGVPAALIASMVKLAATSQRAKAADPASFLSGMNMFLLGNTQEQFVTAAYVYLDAASSTFRYSAAAHPAMLLLRAGNVVELTENGLMLAAFSFATYSTVEHPLQPGDRLVLYTDGLLEATNATGEEFGPQRLSALLKDGAHFNPEAAADHIISSMKTWSKSQNDDLTFVICDYTGSHAA